MNDMIDKILAAQKCGDLFPNDPYEAKRRRNAYAKQIHPDVCTDIRAEKAMKYLNRLYVKAVLCFQNNVWEAANTVWFDKSHAYRYIYEDAFDFGKRYVCGESAVYAFDPSASPKYYQNAVRQIRSLWYADQRMRDEFERVMPRLTACFECQDGRRVLVVHKPKDSVPLDLFFNRYADGLDARHVAWMLSRLNNLVCFLSRSRQSHNGLVLSSLFIHAKRHALYLLGGWWYSVPFDQNLMAEPKEVYDVMPLRSKTDKRSSPITDLESVKGIGRKFASRTTMPKPILDWLNSGSGSNAFRQYKAYDDALKQAYGARKFIPLDVDLQQVYQKEGV